MRLDQVPTPFAQRAIDAVAAALASSDDERHAVGSCPGCGAMLTVHDERAEHMPPLCPEWAELVEGGRQ